MPMLVLIVSIDFDKLLENRRLTACTPNGKSSRVVKVTEDPLIVLIVAVLWPEDGRTNRAGEVLNVKLLS
jgi:hypothetical protein